NHYTNGTDDDDGRPTVDVLVSSGWPAHGGLCVRFSSSSWTLCSETWTKVCVAIRRRDCTISTANTARVRKTVHFFFEFASSPE
ncbi:hypothetical protein quinque_012093, partial [Culex quinquefasciatus]